MVTDTSYQSDLLEDIRFVDSIMHLWHIKASLAIVALLLVGGAEWAAEWLDLRELFSVRRVLVQGAVFGFTVEFVLRVVRAAQCGWTRADMLSNKVSRAVSRAKTAILDRLALYAVLCIMLTFSIAAKNMAVGTWLEVPTAAFVTLVFLGMLVILGIDAAQSAFGSRDQTDDFLRRLAGTWEAIKRKSVGPLIKKSNPS